MPRKVLPVTTHIAILFEFPTVNGGEHSMLTIVEQLSSHGFRFTAIAPPKGLLAERLQDAGIPLIPFEVRGPDATKRPANDLHAELEQILKQLAPDILHSNSLSMSRLVGQMPTSSHDTLRRTGHLRDIVKLSKLATSDMDRNDGLIAVSAATRDFHVSRGLTSDKCQVIHNGVDTNRFHPKRDDQTVVRATRLPAIPPGAKVLLNVGQICLRKGQRNLATSVCQILESRSDVHLLFVGERHSEKQESRDYEDAIRNEFESIGKSPHLHMPGYQNDVAQLMNCSDILVHAAHQEPFGRTLLEAASSELSIIATDVGGTSEMLRPNIDALLVPPNDITAMTAAIHDVLNDPTDATARAHSARQEILKRFTVDEAATQTAEFWKTQLAEPSPPE